jgi:hypothetical protein
MTVDQCKPGQRVRITHTIDRREQDWHTEVTGVVEKVELQQTGSWYAHSKNDKLWLQRIRLRKDDGEISVINVDGRTRIELLDGAARGD